MKIAKTKFSVIDLIKNRWSNRAFDEKMISDEDLNTLFEAASWAPSANNEQPWQYIVAKRGTPAFENLWNCLMPGNQPWTKHASVLVACVARATFEVNGNANQAAMHDVGLANATLLLQATSMHIHGHIMGGFDREKLTHTLSLSENQKSVCMIALGYLGNVENLEEPFKTREMAPRQRKELGEFLTKL